MLTKLLLSMSDQFSWLNVFAYLTMRGICAVLTALWLGLYLGPRLIRALRNGKIGQIVREDDVPFHSGKKGTPTMGGVLILFCVLTSTVLWMELDNTAVWIALAAFVVYGLIGFGDDWLKLKHNNSKGLSVRKKLILQTLAGLLVGALMYAVAVEPAQTNYIIPFLKEISIDVGIWFIPLTALVLVSTSNAVNLTDGLDGLAIMPIILIAGGLAIFSYASGHVEFSRYLAIPYIEGVGEIVIFCCSLIGAGLAFLAFNCYPAQIFMGDVGSMSLGAAVAIIAVLVRQEIVLFLMGGLFVLETISVITQVLSYKYLKRRIWLMSPLHHHFELKGWHESTITVRFWILSFIFVLAGLSTLKLR